MKFTRYIIVLVLHSVFMQASQPRDSIDLLSCHPSPDAHIDNRIIEHLDRLKDHRKEVLLNCSKILGEKRVDRSTLKAVCADIRLVLCADIRLVLDDSSSAADLAIARKEKDITDRYHSLTGSSLYSVVPYWKSYSNRSIMDEAVSLKRLIDKSLSQDVFFENFSAINHVQPSAPFANGIDEQG